MTENKRFNYHVDEVGIYYYVCDTTKKDDDRIILEVSTKYDAIEVCNVFNELNDENEQLKNKIHVLEDDNETYHKSLEKLNLYTKRFIPTKCTNEFKDYKTNRYYWLDHEGNFEGCLELLNLLDCENELLKSENRQLKSRLMEYEKQEKLVQEPKVIDPYKPNPKGRRTKNTMESVE